MKKVLCYGVAVLAVLALTSHVFADTVVGTGGDGFQSWTTAVLDQDRVPYWDGFSSDGSQRGIGYLLTGTQAGTGIAGFPGAIPYWGTGAGAADNNISFTSTGSSQAALQIEIAGLQDSNTFGWYNTAAPGTLNQLFSGLQGAGATATFTPSASYGFYFGTANGTFYTQSNNNSAGDTNLQFFALFQDTANGAYWLGMEDTPGGDWDYNDMVVRVSPAPVPIPPAIWLLGSGLFGMVGIRRRFKK